jgi:uncharacterized membrane protein
MAGSLLPYFPHPTGFILVFALVLLALTLVLRFVFVDFALQRLGISRGAAILVLWASLLGSSYNIPVARLPAEHIEQDETIDFFGMVYVVPRTIELGRTIVAVNLGGAVIPVLLSLYLIIRFGLSARGLLAVVLVTWVAHDVAHPVQGLGIAMPPVVAAATAGIAALLLDRANAPRTAYVAGTLGTLIGADLLNLGKLNLMHAPVVSIGGAGTFDGVFVTGIAAVLLAGFRLGRPRPQTLDR